MFPSTLKEIHGGVFTDCKNLRQIVLNEGLEVLKATGRYDYLEVERGYGKRYDEYYESFIDTPYDRTFEGSGLEEIVLPSTLKEIRGDVFKNFPLKVVRVGENYTSDARNAIGDLEDVQILPKKEINVGKSPLYDLRALRDVVIPEGIEKIGSYWFYNTYIESITIPASTKEIGTQTFYNCNALKNIVFQGENNLEEIGCKCFFCTAIAEFRAPQSLRKIGSAAFANCKNLKQVTLNEGLERLATNKS